MSKPEKRDRIFCNTCMNYNHHTIEGEYESHGDDGDVSWGGTHSLLKCCGCDTPTLRNVTWFSEDYGGKGYDFQPPRKSDKERKPRQFDNIPYGAPIEMAYRQTITAFNQKLYTLAGAGVRLVIEGVCKERRIFEGPRLDKAGKPQLNKHGDPVIMDNLEGKINALADHGYIIREQVKILHEIRFLGNDAAHELDQPSEAAVSTALDIVDHLLEQVYEQPVKRKTLASRIRPRKQKVRKKKPVSPKPPPPATPPPPP